MTVRRLVPAAAVWVPTRLFVALVCYGVIRYDGLPGVYADVGTFATWSSHLAQGHIPGYDTSWQYPPGAALVFLLPRLMPLGGYQDSFVALALIADLLTFVALARLSASGGSRLGVWAWVVGIPFLGLVVYGRYDLFVTFVAVAALAATVRRPVVAGALMSVGALLKVWPVLLLLSGKPSRRLTRPLLGFSVATLVGGLGLSLAFTDTWHGFSSNQANRGLQIESVLATPMQAARLWWDGYTVYSGSGALEIGGPFVRTAIRLSPVLTVIGLGLVGGWWLLRGRRLAWRPAIGFDLVLAAVLIAVVASRVLSPQYMIWLVGLAAACLTQRDTRQRVPVALVIVSAALTGFLFPWHYAGVMFIPDPLGITVLVVRNTMLVVATLWALWSLVLTSRAADVRPRSDAEPVTNVSEPVAELERDLA